MGLMNTIGAWMLNRIAGESAADDEDTPGSAGARPLSPTAQLVGEGVYEDDMIDVQILAPASSHFERYRRLIDSFDEDRESPLEKIVRWFFLLMAYLLPLAVAYAMGKEIGDAYGGVFNFADGWYLGTHTGAVGGGVFIGLMEVFFCV